LSFKPETDDMREAPSVIIANELMKRGAKINAYDPKANDVAKQYYFKDGNNIKFFDSKYDTLNNSVAIILVTEWKEFRSPDFDEIALRIKKRIIFDGRNQYNKTILSSLNFEYYSIG
jgi:UDPglucose 6-dehydrogenase